MSGAKRPRLGRGLDAILPHAPSAGKSVSNFEAPIEEIHPNRDQPRRHFDDEALEQLAQSIRELGVLEPILVRKRSAGGFEIIAGERRWRAAQRAQLRQVPVFVRELSPQQAFEAALVENLQREDLNPVETGRAFQRLLDEFGHTQETIASRVGKDRSTIANAVRLLKLPDDVLGMVESGQLSEGHGRALLAAADDGSIRRLARLVVQKGLSVRETERQARGSTTSADATGKESPRPSANVRDLESKLSRALGATVRVVDRRGKGKLEIPFASYDQLDAILARLL